MPRFLLLARFALLALPLLAGGADRPNVLLIVQGRSIVPNLSDPTAPTKDFAYTVVSRGPGLGRAIRNAEFRYAAWPDGEEFYDLRRDPKELRNEARNPEFAPRLKAAREALKRVVERAGGAFAD